MQYIDKMKQFCITYKRYLGATALFVIFVVILAFCTEPTEREEYATETEENTQVSPVNGTTEASGKKTDDSQSESPATQLPDLAGDLDELSADDEISTLMTNYYTAYAGKDLAALEQLAEPMTDSEKSYITALGDYYEKYDNIVCYSMPGTAADTYLVSVCYDLKFFGVDTTAPGMDFFYVERDGKGNLVIDNTYSAFNLNLMETPLDDEIRTTIMSYEQQEDVVALQQQVQAKYDEAVASDEKLANMIGGTLRNVVSQWRKQLESQKSTEQTTEDTQAAENTQATEADKADQKAEKAKDKKTDQKAEDKKTDKKAEDQKSDKKTKDQKSKNQSEEKKSEEKKSEDHKADEQKSENQTYTVKTNDIVKVRKKADKESDVLGTLTIDVKLTAHGTEGEWTKVEFQGGYGYVHTDLLKKVN